MLGLDPKSIMVIIGIGVVMFVVGGKLFARDEKVENRRRYAAKISTWLSDEGFTYLPDLLTDYSVGDYSGMLQRLKMWVEDTKTDEQRKALLDGVFERQLQVRMADEARRGQILKAVEQFNLLEKAKKEAEK